MTKDDIRKRIWTYLEDKNLVTFPRPCHGRIPNFTGSDEAGERIRSVPEFKEARCIFCAPDRVLKRIREIVLEEGKILAVALPHMTGFLQIVERERIGQATSIKGFRRFGKVLETKIDLFVQGSVAVDLKGNRLGKGKGYGDQEWEHLRKRRLIGGNEKTLTVVHEKQILDDFSELMERWDKRIDYILTPERVIECVQREEI
ncbi:MAG: 5-formyltetrahydrofolate cyclo-ligase [Gemmatimonadota bacterium]|nr:MAG: 5-formyltetrahydrofolate cyclo-ligase [Gemmatimonadota bacterium]